MILFALEPAAPPRRFPRMYAVVAPQQCLIPKESSVQRSGPSDEFEAHPSLFSTARKIQGEIQNISVKIDLGGEGKGIWIAGALRLNGS